jgi:hypothetical protein
MLLAILLVGAVNGIFGQSERVIYSTGFESSESFTAGTTYNNTTIKNDGPVGLKWGTYYGTASTTEPITGSMSMQMRYYTTAPSNHAYTVMNFDLSNVTKVTFKALNTSGNNLQLSYSTDGGTSYTGTDTFTLATSAAEYTYTISATGEYENLRLKFQLVPGTTDKSRVTIDDINIYGISLPLATPPTFTPSSGNYYSSQTVEISSTTPGATIYYTTDGSDPDATKTEYTSAISISSTTTLKAITYATGYEPSMITSATYTFPTNVATIADLRTNTTGFYRLTGEAVLTYQTANRNAKYIQDATGGILIDDNAGNITSTYNIGDGITGIIGTLNLNNGMLQFVPVTNPGAATSTGNTLTPATATLSTLGDFIGQLVKVTNVTIAVTGNFAVSTNYSLSDGTNSAVLRTQYTDLPYIGTEIPSLPQDITGVVQMYNTTPQLIPRSVDDFSNTPISTPFVSIAEAEVPALSAVTDAADTETITVNGLNLTEAISIGISGTDASLFSASPTTLSPTDGTVTDQTVTITYSPTAAGSHTATLTVSSDGATSVTRTLSGSATWAPLDAPVATAASDVTLNGMTANWNAVSGATEYEVSVYTKTPTALPTDLFISEYVEGSSYNKAIEIFNGTGSAVDLSAYSLKKQVNGAGDYGSELVLSGTIANNDVYVIAYVSSSNSSSPEILAVTDKQTNSSAINYNGNDAVALFKNGVQIDEVGVFNQVASWGTDLTLIRKETVNAPKALYDALDWTSHAMDYIVNLGSHTMITSIASPITGSPFTVTGATSKVITGLNPDTEYFYTVVAKNTNVTSEASTEISARTSLITFTGPGDWTMPFLWNSGTVPTSTDNVVINGAVTISSDVAVGSVTNEMMIGTITVNPGKSLTINGDLTNNNTLFILADTVNGSGTIITKGTVGGTSGSNNVQLYLTGSADNSARQWWYVSSPVATALSGTFDPEGTNNIGYFDENLTVPAYVQITSNTASLEVGKGYLLQNKASSTYTFSGGALNSGDITLNLTRTGTTAGQRGFNLVGNPYPSYLNWKAAYEAASTSNIRSTIWYRTSTGSGNGMQFLTYNAATDAGLGGVSNIVPPMQGFWMKVDADGANGSITFTNDHRSHATSSNPMKAPAVDVKQKLRLKVNNGAVSDEMLLIGMSSATDGFEKYDSEKLANNSSDIPELFSFIGQQEIAINTVASLENRQFILGFRPGKESVFTITASEIANLDQQKVILKDHALNTETELTAGSSYEFSSDATATNDRFSIEFRAPGMTTSVDTPEMQAEVFVNADNHIVVQAAGLTTNDRIIVYNLAGQQLISQSADGQVTVIDRALNAGAYIVKVNSRVQKVVVN